MMIKYSYIAFILILLINLQSCYSTQPNDLKVGGSDPQYALVIHGGAGTITKATMTDVKEKSIRADLLLALSAGEKVLKAGGKAIDAVEAAIVILEDSPNFNAGKGAVFTHAGTNEMDASIMVGEDLNAGAIGGVTNIKNPIKGARAVLEKSDHVLLTGKGAEEFCALQNISTETPEYFKTERRWESLQRVIEKEKKQEAKTEDEKHGTVGAVALDKSGNIAAGTSTGGMTNKRYSRIGDSPIIGAGTYANNATCGVSCTGHGEFFIRYAVAHDISALIEYKGLTAQEAGDEVINKKLVEAQGTGGAIIIDKDGNIATPFNTEGMYRASSKNGVRSIDLYK